MRADVVIAHNANVCMPLLTLKSVAGFASSYQLSCRPGLVPPLPLPPHLIALGHNLLAQPLGRKAPIQRIQVANNILAAPHDGILRRDGPVGGDAKLERGEERVRDLVGGEGDLGVLEEAL
jgi:hypothetical protein